MNKSIKLSERILAAISYVLFFPSFKIILTERRKNNYLAFHAARSFLLWIAFLVSIVLLKTVVHFLARNLGLYFLGKSIALYAFIFWAYTIYCGYKVMRDQDINIPFINYSADRLA